MVGGGPTDSARPIIFLIVLLNQTLSAPRFSTRGTLPGLPPGIGHTQSLLKHHLWRCTMGDGTLAFISACTV